METNTRRSFFGKLAAMAAVVTGVPKLFAQQGPPAAPALSGPAMNGPGNDVARRAGGNHIHDGIYYFSGTGFE